MKPSVALLSLLLSALSATSAFAEPAADRSARCWQDEGFPTEADYRRELERWSAKGMGSPPLSQQLRAWEIYRREGKMALDHYRNDKKAHCYMGCRIAQEADYRTAEWAGWKKEYRDLSDCDARSRFEVADYDATLTGAMYGLGTDSARECLEFCASDF
jgi:hypothetical protein